MAAVVIIRSENGKFLFIIQKFSQDPKDADHLAQPVERKGKILLDCK